MSPPFVGTVEGRTSEVVSPKFRTPKEQREWLRQEVRKLGIDPFTVESIEGDCEYQTDQQIMDLLTVLYTHPAAA